MKPFVTSGDVLLAQFSELETELLCDLASQVADLLDESVTLPPDRLLASVGIGGGDALSEDPAIARLLPNGYSEDDEASIEFRRLTEYSLAERKIANARLMITGLLAARGEPIRLDAEARQAWMRSLTDIRIVIAARLGIEKDEDLGRSDTEEDMMMRDVFDWLAMVQTSLIEALEE